MTPSQYEQLARESLAEITDVKNVGGLAAESTDGDGVITMRFECLLGGYPGWQWNVSLAHVEGYDPTVIEAELLPADGSLLAPDWVPWSERLAEYKAAQAAAESQEDDSDLDDMDESDLHDDEMDDDFDEELAVMDDTQLADRDGDEDDFADDGPALVGEPDDAGDSADDADDESDIGSGEADSDDTGDSDAEADEIADYGAQDTEDL